MKVEAGAFVKNILITHKSSTASMFSIPTAKHDKHETCVGVFNRQVD